MPRNYGTRYTTGCGHSWRRLYLVHPRRVLSGATVDCPICGTLLYFPPEQFEGKDPDGIQMNVHAVHFHKILNEETNGEWPADGEGTYYAEFN